MYCCDMMEHYLSLKCEDCGDWDCPDFIVRKANEKIVFPIRDGGSSYVPLNYCPWCGKKVNEESS